MLNVVIVLLNVLHSFIKCGLTRNKDDNLVVTIHRHRYLRDNTQLLKKRLKLYDLTTQYLL